MKRRFLIFAAVLVGFMAASALVRHDIEACLAWVTACVALGVLAEQVAT